ncbi:hypothetical protein CRM22_003273 [Opisthorchis felineus]|uniref:SEA domain-containing protein n=1 Tax=Opisthorchis felineus TaxID=147828 RepID=A0A4S2M240_OPIFE|nr:hypothetical protein CRM22_003273 [Opisthorchis felineus]
MYTKITPCFFLLAVIYPSFAGRYTCVEICGTAYYQGQPIPWDDSYYDPTSKTYKKLGSQICLVCRFAFAANATLQSAWSLCNSTGMQRGSVIVTSHVYFDTDRLERAHVRANSSEFIDYIQSLLEAYVKNPSPLYPYYGQISYVRGSANRYQWDTAMLFLVVIGTYKNAL